MYGGVKTSDQSIVAAQTRQTQTRKVVVGGKMFEAVCKLGLEGIVSKKLTATYRSGPSRIWIRSKIRRRRPQLAPMMGRFNE